MLNTGELGTVTDQILMKRGDRIMQYMQVKLDKSPHLDRWFWADQLGATQETCRITLSGDNGTELYLKVTHDFEGYGSFTIEATGKPKNLKEHDRRGLPFLLTGAMLKGLGIHETEISMSVNGRPIIPDKK